MTCKTCEELVQKYFPFVRELYLSPLTKGDDKISSWQVELFLLGGHTPLVGAGKTAQEALHDAENELQEFLTIKKENP